MPAILCLGAPLANIGKAPGRCDKAGHASFAQLFAQRLVLVHDSAFAGAHRPVGGGRRPTGFPGALPAMCAVRMLSPSG
jgi:hypothetical protein